MRTEKVKRPKTGVKPPASRQVGSTEEEFQAILKQTLGEPLNTSDPHDQGPVNWRYSEGKVLHDFEQYLTSCYDPTKHHYVTADEEIQAIDVWNALGSGVSTSRDTAIKYLMRYGKKDGNNKKDLLKALHFIVFMLHFDHYKGK